MLLYIGGHFIQTLEGPDDVVDATYERIARDPRHRDVFTALREEIESRTFPDWSMGFESVTAEEAGVLPGFNEPRQQDRVRGKRSGPGSGRRLPPCVQGSDALNLSDLV